MNSAWTIEFSRILILVIFAFLFGVVSKAWFIACLVPSVLYISWTLFQIRNFERWIRQGAKTEQAPDTSGIWEIIVQHIYRSQTRDKQHKQKLSFLAGRFKATVSALPDATIVLNEQLEIEWSNQAACQLLGIDSPQDFGQRIDNLIRKPQLHQLLQQSSPSKELELSSPVDKMKTLIFSCVDFDEGKKLLIAKDISQQIAVQKLRKAFIANASHELRTPLTVISGYLEMLETDPQLPSILRQPVTGANRQAVRMHKILDDLLILSRLEEKANTHEKHNAINMGNIIKKLIIDLEKSKGSHKFEIQLEKGLMVRAGEQELHSLYQNLLSNAVKYSAKGSKITVRWYQNPEGYACLSIQDQGEGIAEEHLSRLTERFYRVNVDRSKKVSGTGLGLSIVKHILTNLGGYLDIKSTQGQGSTFTACFPKSAITITTADSEEKCS